MDILYAINVAKSEFRNCFNFSDVSKLLAIADPDLVNFSEGQPCEFGRGGLETLKTRMECLFEGFTAHLEVIVMEIRVRGDVAYDYGWHDPRSTHSSEGSLRRYFAEKQGTRMGSWMYMDNRDVADPFRPEQALPPGE